MFDLPKNGPAPLEPERAYSFRFGNALFIILDSCSEIPDQTAWLERQLSSADAVWKFAMFHFPPYAPTDDYPEIRREWGRLFDQYHVDFVLSGHVHHYLRTKPMHGGAAAASPADGTIYIVSVAVRGDDYDEFIPDCVEKLIGGTALYHTFDIDGSRLTFRAYDAAGALRDELIIRK